MLMTDHGMDINIIPFQISKLRHREIQESLKESRLTIKFFRFNVQKEMYDRAGKRSET
jgi:hypothetical protein